MMGQSASLENTNILGNNTATTTTDVSKEDSSHTELKAQLQCDGKGMKTCLELVLSMKNGKTDQQQDDKTKESTTSADPKSNNKSSIDSETDRASMQLGKSETGDSNKKTSADVKRLTFNKDTNFQDAIGMLIQNCIAEKKGPQNKVTEEGGTTKISEPNGSTNVQHKKFSMTTPKFHSYETNSDKASKLPGSCYNYHRPAGDNNRYSTKTAASESAETIPVASKSLRHCGEMTRNGNVMLKEPTNSPRTDIPQKDHVLSMYTAEKSVKTSGIHAVNASGQSVVQLQAFIDKCLESTWQQQKVGVSEKLSTIGRGQFAFSNEQQRQQQQQLDHVQQMRNGHPANVGRCNTADFGAIHCDKQRQFNQEYFQNLSPITNQQVCEAGKERNPNFNGQDRKEPSRYMPASSKSVMDNVRPTHYIQGAGTSQYLTAEAPHRNSMLAKALNQQPYSSMANMHPAAKHSQLNLMDGSETAFDAKDLVNKISCQARAINKFFSSSGDSGDLPYSGPKMSQTYAMKHADHADYASSKSRSVNSPATSPQQTLSRHYENSVVLPSQKRIIYEDSYMHFESKSASVQERISSLKEQRNMSPAYRNQKDENSNVMHNHGLQDYNSMPPISSASLGRIIPSDNRKICSPAETSHYSRYPELPLLHMTNNPKETLPHCSIDQSKIGQFRVSPGAAHNPHFKPMETSHHHFTAATSVSRWEEHHNVASRYQQVSPNIMSQSTKVRGLGQEPEAQFSLPSTPSPRIHTNSSQLLQNPAFVSPTSSPHISHKEGSASRVVSYNETGKQFSVDHSRRGSTPQRRHTISDVIQPEPRQYAGMRPLSAPDVAAANSTDLYRQQCQMNTIRGTAPIVTDNALDLSVKERKNEVPVNNSCSTSTPLGNQEYPLDLSKKKPSDRYLLAAPNLNSPSRNPQMLTSKKVPANILLKHLEYSVQKYCGSRQTERNISHQGQTPPVQQYNTNHYQKPPVTQNLIPPQQSRNSDTTVRAVPSPHLQYVGRKDFSHGGGYVPDSRPSQQGCVFRQPAMPVNTKHPSQLSHVTYPVSPLSVQTSGAYATQGTESSQIHRNKSTNPVNEKAEHNSKKHDISKHEPVQNLLGNHAPDDVLYLICKLCGQTYGSPYSFRKHFRNQHGFEPRPHHTVVQSISATISLLKGKNGSSGEASVKVEEKPDIRSINSAFVDLSPADASAIMEAKKADIDDVKFNEPAENCPITNTSTYSSVSNDEVLPTRNLTEIPSTDQEETKFLECPECYKQFQLNDFGSYKKHCRSHDRNKHGAMSEYVFDISGQVWERNLPDLERRQCSSVPAQDMLPKDQSPSAASSISVDRVLRPGSYDLESPREMSLMVKESQCSELVEDYPKLLCMSDIKQENVGIMKKDCMMDTVLSVINSAVSDSYKTENPSWSGSLQSLNSDQIKTELEPPNIVDNSWEPSDDSGDEHRLKIITSETDDVSPVSHQNVESEHKTVGEKSDSDEKDFFTIDRNASEPTAVVSPGPQLSVDRVEHEKASRVISVDDSKKAFDYRHKKFGSQFKRKETIVDISATNSKRQKSSEGAIG